MRNLLFLSILILFPISLFAAPMKVGLLVPLSGEYASAGEYCKQGFEVARTILDKAPELKQRFEFVYGDSRAAGKEAISEFQRLTDVEHVEAIALIRSPVGMALNPVSKQKSVPILGGVAHADFIKTNPYSYRFWHTVGDEAQVLAEMLLKRNEKRVAMITTEDDWLISLADAQHAAFKERGIEILVDEEVNPEDSDFRTIIAKVVNQKPDALILNLGITNLGVAFKQLNEQKITLNKYTPFWADSPDVIDVSGIDALKNSTYFEMDKSKPNFLNRFKELFPESKPVTATYSCYTTLAAILDAFKTNPPTNSVEAIESLNKLESFMTLDGSLLIKNRETQYKVVAKTFDGKTWN